MMPHPALTHLSVSAYNETKDLFHNPLREVLSPQNCAQSVVTLPAQDYNVDAANGLMAQLLILGLSTLK